MHGPLAGLCLFVAAGLVAQAIAEAEPEEYSTLKLPSWQEVEKLPSPDAAALLQLAAAPLAAHWLSQDMLDEIGKREASCAVVIVSVDWVIRRLQEEFHKVSMSAHQWQDRLIRKIYDGLTAEEFFAHEDFRGLMYPAIASHRNALHTQEFMTIVALMHGQRCFFSGIHEKLGDAVMRLAEISKMMHLLQFSISFKGVFSVWDDSTDVLRHVDPIWNVISATAKYSDALAEVRIQMNTLRTLKEDEDVPEIRGPDWHEPAGAFSEMHYMHRQMTNGWHVDHGLLASLLRLWQPPPGFLEDDAEAVDVTTKLIGNSRCHTSVADFGAGGGRYCEFLNSTGEFCCSAYDGTPNVAKHTDGKVQTQRLDKPFDLGRSFDWVLCLEVAEHVPREDEAVLLHNLRRHSKIGLILSWSADDEGPHQNARPWHEVRQMVEAVGFALDAGASAQLRPQLPWMRRAVHVFRAI